MKKVNFIFCVHNHQPIGNFDHVFESAYEDAYLPFIEAVTGYPWFKFCAHYSGTLLEWIKQNRLDFFLKLRKLIDDGRLELLGGGFYEPIFTMLPDQDAVGQIEMMNEFLERIFGSKPTGLWLSERVWEQQLCAPISGTGLKYTVLDDFHFKVTGINEDNLDGFFLTEDEGAKLYLFAISEKLRYGIPFKNPEEVVQLILDSGKRDDSIVIYADDGEKFGVWPKTKAHVYDNGWLVRFLDLLELNLERIKMITFSEALEKFKPRGRIYLPSCSYREMGQWALFLHGQDVYESLADQLRRQGRFDDTKHLIPSGYWRNFMTKYEESNRMYGRMLNLSSKIRKLQKKSSLYQKAIKELYKAQCNCPYWHGVFGGLYLPHLRESVYRHLIRAEKIIREKGKAVDYELVDIDFDECDELRLFNKSIGITISASKGGHITEFDLYEQEINTLSTISRRPEPYHDRHGQTVSSSGSQINPVRRSESSGIKTIHEINEANPEVAGHEIIYDSYLKDSLIDHFFREDVDINTIQKSEKEVGDFVDSNYQLKIDRSHDKIVARMFRRGLVKMLPFIVQKHVMIRDSDFKIEVEYELVNESSCNIDVVFGVEFNVSSLCGLQPDCFFHFGNKIPIGQVTVSNFFDRCTTLYFADKIKKICGRISATKSNFFYTYPVNTVSQSESGLELLFQGLTIIPAWRLSLNPGKRFNVIVIQEFSGYER